MADICVGTVPLVTAGTIERGKRIGPFTPTAAGPWMWAIVAGPRRLLNDRSIVIWVWAPLRATAPEPVAGDAFGGTSFPPTSVVAKVLPAASITITHIEKLPV